MISEDTARGDGEGTIWSDGDGRGIGEGTVTGWGIGMGTGTVMGGGSGIGMGTGSGAGTGMGTGTGGGNGWDDGWGDGTCICASYTIDRVGGLIHIGSHYLAIEYLLGERGRSLADEYGIGSIDRLFLRAQLESWRDDTYGLKLRLESLRKELCETRRRLDEVTQYAYVMHKRQQSDRARVIQLESIVGGDVSHTHGFFAVYGDGGMDVWDSPDSAREACMGAMEGYREDEENECDDGIRDVFWGQIFERSVKLHDGSWSLEVSSR